MPAGTAEAPRPEPAAPAGEPRKAPAERPEGQRRVLAKKKAQALREQRQRAERRRAEERRAARAVAAGLSREVGKFWRRCCEVVQREEDLRKDALDRKRRIESLEAMVSRTEALSNEVSGQMRERAPSGGSEDEDESMASGSEGRGEEEEEEGEEEAEGGDKDSDDEEEDEEEQDADDETLNAGRNSECGEVDDQAAKDGLDLPRAARSGSVAQVGEQGRDQVGGAGGTTAGIFTEKPPKEPEATPEEPEKNPAEKRDRLRTAIESFTKEMGESANFDRQNLSKHITTEVPVLLLRRPIREYQHVGLHWLATLHDKSFNGILADEMGLGKTVMTIALLAHLAIAKEIWGPHLIVVPTSVQMNWEMEFKRWVPGFRVLTYHGTSEERKQKRVGWNRHKFNACIVSYSIAIQDARILKMKPWYYMILDEAQHIKNFRSQKWQQLIRFRTARRLLLTGTPLQNDLMELWSLMHFLMPDVFESYSDFKGWFSDPLNLAIQRQTVGQESGLISRLHEVLRPFMLRRLKSEVEKQMPAKHEYIEKCPLSRRQLVLYEEFMQLRETQRVLRQGDYLGMMSVLMQLRKVCNHPELFEPRQAASPFAMAPLQLRVPGLALMGLWAAVGGRQRGEPRFCSLLLPLLSIWRHEEAQLAACRGTLVLARAVRTHRPVCESPSAVPAVWRAPLPRSLGGPGAVDLTQDGGGPGQSRGAALAAALGAADGQAQKRRRVQVGHEMWAESPSMGVYSTPMAAPAALGGIPSSLQPASLRVSPRSSALFWEFKLQLARANKVRQLERTRATKAVDFLCWEVARDRPLWGADGLELLSLAGTWRDGPGPPVGGPLSWSRTLNSRLRPRRPPLTLRWRPAAAAAAPASASASASAPSQPPRRPRWAVEAAEPFAEAAAGAGGAARPALPALGPPRAGLGGRPKVSRLGWRRRRRRRGWWEEGGAVEYLCRAVHAELEEDLEARICKWVLLVPRVLITADNPRSLVRPLDPRASAAAKESPKAPGVEEPHRFHVELLCHAAERGQLARQQHARREEQMLYRALRGACPCSPDVLTRVAAPMRCRLPEKHYLESDCGKLTRLRVLLQGLQKNGSKCIIFTQFSKMLDVLESFVSYHRFTYLRLDGSVKVEMRQQLVDCFNNDERVFLFISSTRAGGVGINLTGANVVIFYDSDWNPAMDRQAMDRAHRIGQTRDVHIYRLISEHTVEENIWTRQLQKRQLDDLVVDQGRFNAESLRVSGSGRRASLWTAGEVRSMLTGDAGGAAPNKESAQVRMLLTAPTGAASGGAAPEAAASAEARAAMEAPRQSQAQATVEFERLLRAVEDRDDAELAERATRELRETERVFERDFDESATGAGPAGEGGPGAGAHSAAADGAAKAAEAAGRWLECLPELVRWGVCRVQLHGVSDELQAPGMRAHKRRARQPAARARQPAARSRAKSRTSKRR